MTDFKVGKHLVGDDHPTFFIADISANHDGDISRALQLCKLAKQSGADCAKFQHFRADHIVSERGFEDVGKLAHQAGWKESVVGAFKRLSVPWEWTETIKQYCDSIDIEFMSTPYDMGCVDHLEPYVNAYKIGSGDITYTDLIDYISGRGKPVFMACGASDMYDVSRAMSILRGSERCLMQCNTNYTGDVTNYRHIQLTTIPHFKALYPDAVIGLSDHTIGHVAVLGAVALGARAVEKHFTDDPGRVGPDHPFSLSSVEWRTMVDETRMLEEALGDGRKRIEANERETVILQRRSLRASTDLEAGRVLRRADFEALRPAPIGAIPPYKIEDYIGAILRQDKREGDAFYPGDFL